MSDIETISDNWRAGKKRLSRNSNEVFLTRKERRLWDRQFLDTRERKRVHKKSRRAKSVRD